MRLGILGTMVWDRIESFTGDTVERWGGISYSLAAGAAALPKGWSIRPIIRVGDDLAGEAMSFLEGLPGLESMNGIRVVPEPNNRVHLRYEDPHHREEILSGGISAWDWEELEPRLEGLDALYVNLISGFELELETGRRLRDHLRGPLYADLHSLLMGVAPDGARVPRPLAKRDEWMASFDVVQVNEEELALTAEPDDPVEMAREAVRSRGGVILVTGGPAGARWLAPSDRPRPWESEAGEVASGAVPANTSWEVGDPTGCGDVWGATCFIRLLRGATLTAAMIAANRAAGLNVNYRGADGLYDHLRKQTWT